MSGTETGGRFAPTAIRMRALRRASTHPERQAFAKFLGITAPRLSNFENGFAISSDMQNRLMKKMSWLSLDWLLHGREGGLPVAKLQILAELVTEESDTTTPRSRSKGTSGR